VRAIVEAIASAANLAALIREESTDKELRRCAQRVLLKLSTATDRVIELKEAK